MDVVVVELPAKAKTINKYLGRNYKVLASYGHVRDLPAKDGSVRPDDDFSMSWEVDGPSSKRLTEIAKAVKDADGLILATDPDREGEAISWHVLEVLKNKRVLKDKPVSRVVFNAITKQSVLDAMANPRQIDAPLVDAYLARRALDYLVGFTLSPVLWRKLPGSRSAGRVQSVALRLVSDREVEIEKFIRQDYWQIAALLGTPRAESFEARLTGFEGKRLQKLDVSSQAQADDIRSMLEGASFRALSVEAKPTKRNPGPPFTTSTLQQAASSRLGFSATRTMQIAQRLYEGLDIGGETAGLITYMRTDGVQMAPEAISAARAAIGKEFGEKYLPEKPRYYSTKAKNAQEAHEAIRPTDFFRTPGAVRQYLDADQFRLYDMIWKRAIASQMQPAEIERTTAEIEAVNGSRTATLRAVGSVVRFDGFIAAYTDQKEDDAEDEEDRRLPEIRAGESLKREKIDVSKHTTEPPPRYTEATLIKKMEELGIGRPSTYTAILKTLEDREYVTIDKRRLIPQAKGRLLSAFLESFFEKYVEYDFTASLEEKLDEISDGKLEYKQVLRDFWRDFSASVNDIKDLQNLRGARRAERRSGAAAVSGTRRRQRSSYLPEMRHRKSVAAARQKRRLHRLLELSGMQLHAPVRRGRMPRTAARPKGPRCSARTPTPARRSPCALAVSAPTSSVATARRQNAPACPRAGRRTVSTTKRHWRFCRCRVTSASIRRAAR